MYTIIYNNVLQYNYIAQFFKYIFKTYAILIYNKIND